MTKEEVAELLEEAAKNGAREAIIELFIDPTDPNDSPAKVRKDVGDLRVILTGYRSVKSGIFSGLIRAFSTALAGAILAFIIWWVSIGFKTDN